MIRDVLETGMWTTTIVLAAVAVWLLIDTAGAIETVAAIALSVVITGVTGVPAVRSVDRVVSQVHADEGDP